jgi:DNA-binding NtrC family response regulator
LELYRHNPEAFDLLITDYTMPKMTGAQLAKSVLEINADLPVILMSGIESMNLETEAKQVGVSGFLGKPVNIREIAVLVRQLLDTSRHNDDDQ